jgi:hypothetical protein
MAVQLEDFLRDRTPARKSEVQQIGQTAGEVLRGFQHAFDGKRRAWPYRIDRGKEPLAPEASEYSFSTNAMVLFALKTLLGYYEDSIVAIGGSQSAINWASGHVALLTPMLARPDPALVATATGSDLYPEARPESWKALREGFRSLVEKTAEELTARITERILSQPPLLTYSGTFGDNDPFTLCWVLESMDVAKAWVGQVRARTKQALERPREFKLGPDG